MITTNNKSIKTNKNFFLKNLGKKILYSNKLETPSNNGIKKEICLVITNEKMYVFKNEWLKRNILLSKINYILYSVNSSDFIINFNDTYDLYLNSENQKMKVIEKLLFINESINNIKFISFYFYKKFELENLFISKKKFLNKENIILNVDNLKRLNHGNYYQILNNIQKLNIYNLDTLNIKDFIIIKELGEGNFGKVVLAMKKDTKKLYAIKIFLKNEIILTDQLDNTLVEKDIMKNLNHQFIVPLYYSFQNEIKIFFVNEFLEGGDLYQLLSKEKYFDEEKIRFYVSSLILAIGHLHNNNYIHRDIKLENILINKDGYIKLTDFGLSKFIKKDKRSFTLCGTPNYLSPEVILNFGFDINSDWWSWGIVIYEMANGISPFYNKNINIMFKNIIKNDVKFNPKIKLSIEIKDLIIKLLDKSPNTRIGSVNGNLEIMNHNFFKGFNWSKLISKNIRPKYIPKPNKYKISNNNITNDIYENRASTNVLNWISKFKEEFEKFN